MRAAPCVAATVLLACLVCFSGPVHAAQPAEFQTLLDNVQALKVGSSNHSAGTMQPKPSHRTALLKILINFLQVPGVKGSIGDALKGALTGWEYTLPLEFVRKGQAYVGPSLRLRRVMNDLMAGKCVTLCLVRVGWFEPARLACASSRTAGTAAHCNCAAVVAFGQMQNNTRIASRRQPCQTMHAHLVGATCARDSTSSNSCCAPLAQMTTGNSSSCSAHAATAYPASTLNSPPYSHHCSAFAGNLLQNWSWRHQARRSV